MNRMKDQEKKNQNKRELNCTIKNLILVDI